MLDDLLNYLGGALDKPGRAVRGLLGGRDEDALAFIPFSDSLGITNEQNAVSGKKLAEDWFGLDPNSLGGRAAGFGLDVATDPLTYFGGFLGRMAGKGLGRAAEAASIARGPGYKTAAESLFEGATSAGRGAIEDLAAHPAFGKALSEVPEGSRYLGHGAEAVVFKAPDGSVARIGEIPAGSPLRPIDPGVLPTTRAMDFAGPKNALRVERSPFAPALPDLGYQSPELTSATKQLGPDLARRGIDFVDSHAGNVGVYQGRPVVIDTGAIAGLNPGELPLNAAVRPRLFPELRKAGEEWAAAGSPMPSYPSLVPPGGVDRKTAFLLDLIGGQSAMQKALAAGQAAPRYERLMGRAGAAAGAVSPVPLEAY